MRKLLEKQIEDYWNVDGEKEVSDTGTGWTRFVPFIERLPEGYTWFGEGGERGETYKETNTTSS